ncbi:hypothetical protein B5S31_g2740 [[Candida] boidinii]|nr:hypothetical protein B5S31_g2740 [[Candida] boidinii]
MFGSKALFVQFFYEDPPNGYFSPEYPIIGGTGTNFNNLKKSTDDLYLNIKFLKKLDKVDKINIIFSGEIKITFEHQYTVQRWSIQYNRYVTETRTEILTESLSLFNFTQTVFNNRNSTFQQDQIIKLNFNEFKFPFDKFYLPSSYEFSNSTWKLSINYGLTCDLQRSTSIFHKNYKEYLNLNYQSGNYLDLSRNLNYLYSNSGLIGSNSHVFKKKPKKFILDEGTTLIENPLNASHRHTRIFRSIFNNNYKNSNYKNLTKDIDLILKFKPNNFNNNLNNSFDISKNFISQLGFLRIETSSILNNNLVPDFIINKKSTELGKFHFKYLKIFMIDNLNLHCKGFNSGLLQKKIILIDTINFKRESESLSPPFINSYNNTDINDEKNAIMHETDNADNNINKKDNSISFDICNFQQDPENADCFFTELNISELLKNSSISFPKPILSSFTIPNFFENDVSIEIEIGIDSRFKDDERTKVYRLNFGVILTNNSNLPQQLNQQNQQYNNNYVAATPNNSNNQYQYNTNNSYNNINGVILDQAPALDPNPTLDPPPPLSPNQHSFQNGKFGDQSPQPLQLQQQQYQGYSSPAYPPNTPISATAPLTPNSSTAEGNHQLTEKEQEYQQEVNQNRQNNNSNSLHVPQSQPLSNSSSSAGISNEYYNTEENNDDLPPPQYTEFSNSSELTNESTNQSSNQATHG